MTEVRRAERRRTPRISVNFPVMVTWGRKQYRWQAREFSEFGILLAATLKEVVGEDVDLDLHMEPTDSSISLKGVVVYSTAAGVGVRFKNLSPEQVATFRAYIQRNSKKP